MDISRMRHGRWAKWALYIFLGLFFLILGLLALAGLLQGE